MKSTLSADRRSTPVRRRSGRLAVAVLAMALPLAWSTPAFAEEPAGPITDGRLDWGVKESFRSYVTGPIGGGEISVSEGAETNADGTFGFTGGSGEYDDDSHDITADFNGKVQFLAHPDGDDWALDLTIGQLRVDTDTAAGTGGLIADVASKDADSGEVVEYDDVTLAQLDLSTVSPEPGDDGYTTVADIPAVLTADGEAAFGGFYPAGTALDTVSVSVKAETTGDPAPADGTVVDGYLDWGVKESFRNYIVGPIAKGKVELSDGAGESDAGFRFGGASGEFDDTADSLDVDFVGGVRFLGHKSGDEYELDLTFDELAISVADGAGVLRSGGVDIADIDVAALTPDGDVLSLTDVPTTLTADGAKVFDGYYEAGQELDPLTVQLALSEDAELPGGNAGDGEANEAGGPGFRSGLPVTGNPVPSFVSAGAALLLAGGFAAWWSSRGRARRAG